MTTPTDHPETPDFSHLLQRDLADYLIGRGFARVAAIRRAKELMTLIEREADKVRKP